MKLYFIQVHRRDNLMRPVALPFTRIAIVMSVLLLAAFSTVVSADRDLQVISSTQSEFHFVRTIDPVRLSWFIDSDSLPNAFTTIQVGVPQGASAEIVLADARRPVQIDTRLFEGNRTSSRTRPAVQLSEPYSVRGRRLVSLRIYPVVAGMVNREVEIKVVFTGAVGTGATAEPDPYFEKIFAAAVANYEQFQTWLVAPRIAPKPTALLAGPFAGGGEWFKIAVDQTGLHRIRGSQLESAGLSLTGLSSGDIRIHNGGGLPLPVDNAEPRPSFVEIPVIVEDGGDGFFDSNDYLLFFGESQDRWVFEGDDEPYWVNHPYTDHNVYWLTVSTGGPGLRMTTQSGVSTGPAVTSFHRYIHMEQDAHLRVFYSGSVGDYFTWYWTDQSSFSFYVSTPGVVASEAAEITIAARTVSPYVDAFVNGTAATDKLCSSRSCSFLTTSLVDGANQIDLQLTGASTYPPYLDYFELVCLCDNLPSSDRLDLTMGKYDGPARLEVIDGFSSAPLILDVSNPLDPSIVTGNVSGGIIAFDCDADSSVFRRYYLAPVSAALTPESITAASPGDLYVALQQVDLIVIAPSIFLPALQDYVDYRQSGGFNVQVASLDDVMDNFAWGLYDPSAIRDFLKYTFDNYPAPIPAAALLVGDANYDYLNYLSTNVPNYMPPYLHAWDSSSSDDNYVFFGDYGILDSDTSWDTSATTFDYGFDMICARWPVRSDEEVASITDKIMTYESASNFGIWRNRVTLVADDEHTSASSTELIHGIQTELLEKDHLPRLYTRDKIYLWEYPFVGFNKPEVNDAIVKAFNDGTLIMNYVGHGNPDVWAHEHVLDRMDDLPRLRNTERLPLTFAASCAIGFYDHPTRVGMAEDLLSITNGGAIGVISATRSVYASANAEFNQATFDVLFEYDSLSMCGAMFAAKLMRQYVGGVPSGITNDRKYVFFGGPMVGLATPRLDVDFSEAPQELVAMGTTTVRGRVIDESAGTYGQDGVLYVNVHDSEREKVYRLVETGDSVAYRVTGPTIYRGSATIENGTFDFQFVNPLDIGYGGQGARISVYARFDNIDGAGLIDSISVSDSVGTITDSAGPAVQVAFEGRHGFVSGDIIGPDEQMRVIISDPSGVNLTGALGHGITMEIDYESENLINLTSLFEFERDDFTTGSLTYQMVGLQPGNHHFKIKAWDNANNSSVYEFDARLEAMEELAIRELLNYPNPMRESTRFSFYLTQRVEKFSLELFTLSGKKIRTFHRHSLEPGFYDDIVWYGIDSDGGRVATEVYIYKATAYPANGGGKVESLGKLVLIN
ncbi:MAG: type IX secretion system sortase PorU [Candidatus Zixiibacteriota bacterium]|nr:MAG: type IX secretion system sortase PorU [candidate division Zixibacteria bacterium]